MHNLLSENEVNLTSHGADFQNCSIKVVTAWMDRIPSKWPCECMRNNIGRLSFYTFISC